jgi:hypothetical protein
MKHFQTPVIIDLLLCIVSEVEDLKLKKDLLVVSLNMKIQQLGPGTYLFC